jgi:hypothetical protein
VFYVSWIPQSRVNYTRVIKKFLFVFQLEKEVCAPWFSEHMSVFMLKKIPISDEVNDNLKSEILAVGNRGGIEQPLKDNRFLLCSRVNSDP